MTVLSYGGGQDSFAILLLLIFDREFRQRYAPGGLIAVFADTMNEHSHTYIHIEQVVKPLCRTHGVAFYDLDPSVYATGDWRHGLAGFYQAGDRIGSKAYPKTCTDNLKIRPIYRFLNEYLHIHHPDLPKGQKRAITEYAQRYGKIRMLIGIARGEEGRATPDDSPSAPLWMRRSIIKIYPLIERGMDRADCQKYAREQGYTPPFPSNCIMCPFISEIELLWLFATDPGLFHAWADLERKKIKKFEGRTDRNYGVFGHRLLPEVLREARIKYSHMTIEELTEYKFSHGHCVMSKY